MKLFKKVLAVALVGAMAVSMLTACSGSKSSKVKDPPPLWLSRLKFHNFDCQKMYFFALKAPGRRGGALLQSTCFYGML